MTKRILFLLALAIVVLPGCKIQTIDGRPPDVTFEDLPANGEWKAQDPVSPPSTREPDPTYTPYPTHTPYPTQTPPPSPTSTSLPTPAPMPSPTPSPVPATDTPMPTTAPTRTTSGGAGRPPAAFTPASTPAPALTWLPDTDPAPPLTIRIDSNRLGDNHIYQVSGIVRNDGDETYEAISIDATFFDANGFRYGPLKPEIPCLLLDPGEECPFRIELAARNLVSVHLHPNGRVAKWRQSAAVTLSNVRLYEDSAGSVRVTGTATNANAFAVKNVIVIGVLLDDSGQMVSQGWSAVLKRIAPGEKVEFSLRIPRAPFGSYRLYAQAERDG